MDYESCHTEDWSQRHLAKVDVEGSNPFSRSKPQISDSQTILRIAPQMSRAALSKISHFAHTPLTCNSHLGPIFRGVRQWPKKKF